MNKSLKKLSILIGASFLLLTGCITNHGQLSSSYNSSQKNVSYPANPEYGDKIPEEDYENVTFAFDYGHVFDRESSEGCLLFSDLTTLQEYTASLETKATQTGPTYEEAIGYFKSFNESFFDDYYLLVTPELYLPNPLYHVSFDGLYINGDHLSLRLIKTKSEGNTNEVIVHYYFKVSISKKYQINSIRLAVEEHY